MNLIAKITELRTSTRVTQWLPVDALEGTRHTIPQRAQGIGRGDSAYFIFGEAKDVQNTRLWICFKKPRFPFTVYGEIEAKYLPAIR